MNVLVLGGTQFLGHHIVERLHADGAGVTIFHRGVTKCALPAGVQERFGDRDVDLSSLLDRTWDAIVDVAAYRPEQARRALELSAVHYVFISTVSVYADLSQPGVDERSPVIESYDAQTEDGPLRYGGDKAACERLVRERYGEAAAILRPGVIAGAWDPTDRFTYWCERALRGGEILAPAPPEQPAQIIDARDVAAFASLCAQRRIGGTYNLTGPAAAATLDAVLAACIAAAAALGAAPASLCWADPAVLRGAGVYDWIDLPLWIDSDRFRGICSVRNARALGAGLTLRPVAETVRAILAWTQTLDPSRKREAGLSAQRERELLALVKAS